MQIDKLSIPGGRTWDTEIDGSAHFGLIPDFVEEIRLEGGEEAVTAFYNSAEAYIQLWEKVYKEQ
jgi:DNA gyrase inhibitor GyrI